MLGFFKRTEIDRKEGRIPDRGAVRKREDKGGVYRGWGGSMEKSVDRSHGKLNL